MLNRTRTLSVALSLGLMAAMSLSGPAAAAQIASHGLTGDYGTIDNSSQPGGKCGYSPANASGYAFLRWIKVNPPLVAARNLTGAREHQQVRFQFKIQRSNNGGPWKNVASSPVQTKTAYDDTSAPFTAMKAYYNGTSPTEDFRALLKISWLRNGSTEGWVKTTTENYSVKWTVGSPDFVFTEPCSGRAD